MPRSRRADITAVILPPHIDQARHCRMQPRMNVARRGTLLPEARKPVTNQVTTPSDGAGQSQPQPDTGYRPGLPVSDPAPRGQTELPGMACKRSGVRIPIAPLGIPGPSVSAAPSGWLPRSVDRHLTVVLDVTGWHRAARIGC